MQKPSTKRLARVAAMMVLALTAPRAALAGSEQAQLPGDRAYPESIAATADGTLYVSSFASGGVFRIMPGGKAEQWIAPGAFDTRSTFGVLVDPDRKLLWVCSNDISALGVPGPGNATGSRVAGFDLESGEGKISLPFPGSGNLCNDMAIGSDGSLYVTNSAKPQILRWLPGAEQLEVFVENATFNQPTEKGSAGLDGIAFGADGNLYVNTFSNGDFFRVDVKDGAAGKVTKLSTSRPLKFPDGLRPTGAQTFIMAEGGGTLDRVSVSGDKVDVESFKEGLLGPTSVALVGDTVWAPEGQLSHLFDAKSGPPKLPFHVVAAAAPDGVGH
jgi:sugar lactone lactonase YvrE